MIYSAKDQFQDWYSKGLKKEPTDSELNYRKEIVDKILKANDESKDYWLKMLDLFFGSLVDTDPFILEFVALFRENDDNFPVSQNQNLLKVLAGNLIAQKIEQKRSWIADLLSLAILTYQWQKSLDIPLLEEVTNIAEVHLNNETIQERNFDIDSEIEKPKITTTSLKVPVIPADNPTSNYSAVVAAIVKNAGTIPTDLTTVVDTQNTINELMFKVLKAQSEELNILWSLFGGHSATAELSYNKIEWPSITVIAPIDLNAKTKLLPGLPNSFHFLEKIYSLNGKATNDKITFSELIDSGKFEAFQTLASDLSKSLEFCCPILYAARLMFEFGDSTDWKPLFTKRVKINEEVSPILFSTELYRELMIKRIYNY